MPEITMTECASGPATKLCSYGGTAESLEERLALI